MDVVESRGRRARACCSTRCLVGKQHHRCGCILLFMRCPTCNTEMCESYSPMNFGAFILPLMLALCTSCGRTFDIGIKEDVLRVALMPTRTAVN